MKRIYLNGFEYFLKETASVTPIGDEEEVPAPSEVITLEANVTLYREYISGENERGAFIQEK